MRGMLGFELKIEVVFDLWGFQNSKGLWNFEYHKVENTIFGNVQDYRYSEKTLRPKKYIKG